MFSHIPDRIVYLRHPQSLHNIAYDEAIKTIANRDSPLTSLGEKQMKITAEYLLQRFGKFDRVFASQYLRAQTIPSFADFDFIVDELLNERNQGLMHEMGPKAFFEKFPDELVKIKESYYHYRAPGGETCEDVERRQLDFLLQSGVFAGCDSVLLSGHGISGKCFRKILTKASIADWHSWSNLFNASVSVYERRGIDFVCTEYNHIPWAGQLEIPAGFEA